jgi:hypothetical protein
MAVAVVVLIAALSGFVVPAGVVTYFPGSFFDARAREPLQRQVMTSWPGPTELVRLWRETELSEQQRVALLIGGAAYHDPVMLPLYRESLATESQILRQAAIYGYRDLLADRLPRVDVTIDEQIVESYADEMRWMDRTLSRNSLIEMWLQSALVQEGVSLPGYKGVRLTRSPRDCFRAAERLVVVQDLDLLVTAFELSKDQANRIVLTQLIEAVSLEQFIIMPTGARVGWGMHVYESAFQALSGRIRRWRKNGCTVDGEAVLRKNLRSQGVEVADPLGPEACRMWLMILKEGSPQQWWLAARQLYACGGPWHELSALRPDTNQNRARRDRLVRWYKPRNARMSPNR